MQNENVKNGIRPVLQESIRLQKEAVGIQQAMEKAIAGQQALSVQAAGTAGLQMQLLKVRVFIRTMRELEERSRDLAGRIRQAEEMIFPDRAGMEMRGLVPDPGAPDAGEKDLPSGRMDRAGRDSDLPPGRTDDPALEQRRQSLEVTRILLAQIEAEASGLVSAYRELEAALVDAGRAMDDARAIQLNRAAAEAADRIRQAAGITHA